MDIGIDLGTTYSVIAVRGKVALADGYPEGLYLEECDVTIIPTPDHDLTFPSVLWRDSESGQYVVGLEAKHAATQGESPIMWSKRKIGTTEPLPIGDESLTAKEVATRVLGYLKQCAERALGSPVERAVITHPAYFHRNQVEETRQAAIDAGFDMHQNDQMIMEPVAAALAYARSDPRDPLRILIYDLGGGTFDVTILERTQGVINMLAYDGDRMLGGCNFDRKIARWIRDRSAAKGRPLPNDPAERTFRAQRAQILQFAERVKEQLAMTGDKLKQPIDVRCDFLVDEMGRPIQLRERMTQEEFVNLIQADIEETIACCHQCLSKASLPTSDLDYVLLVGGSTYGPWIVRAVRDALAIEPQQFRPDVCVAAGAAIQLGLIGRVARGDSGLKVHLNAPEESILPTAVVSGHVEGTDATGLDLLQAVLRSALDPQERTPLAEEGRFAFPLVTLASEGPTRLVLEIQDANQNTRIEHAFTITYAPTATDVTVVNTVLPKPLYIRAANGLVALAEEATPLPSGETTVPLRRVFASPTLDIDLLHEEDVVGTIAITGIPETAGEGAPVILRLRISEKCEIFGTAEVLSARTSTPVCQCPVQVHFTPVTPPTRQELEARFRELEYSREERMALSDRPEERMLLAGKGSQLTAEIQELLRDPDSEPLELQRSIRDLEQLVTPPPDDLDPPRSQFDALLASCTDIVTNQSSDPQIQAYQTSIQKCEREGKEAFRARDQRKWSAVCDSLSALHDRLLGGSEKAGPREIPETEVMKDQSLMAVQQARAALLDARQERVRENADRYESKFKALCDEVNNTLDRTEQIIHAIPDNLRKEEALPKIQLVFHRLRRAEHDIQRLARGIEVNTST